MHRLIPCLLLLTACADVENPGGDQDVGNEVITTVELAFTPVGGGAEALFRWSDPENDGDAVVDPITLAPGDYRLAVRFLNELENPAEDLTLEVDDESDQHQVFFTGSAVDGPATDNAGAILVHAYADTDADGLPVGLDNDVTVVAAGTGTLTVTLRHMPPEDGNPVKVAGLAEDVAAGGFGAIGGDDDAQVDFDVTVP